jgi:hypothetical protein
VRGGEDRRRGGMWVIYIYIYYHGGGKIEMGSGLKLLRWKDGKREKRRGEGERNEGDNKVKGRMVS